MSQPKPVTTQEFVQQVLAREFDGDFRKVGPYQYMFKSDSQLAYFQNFDKSASGTLWYRLKRTALTKLRESEKDAFVCFTNPSEGIAYILPVDDLNHRVSESGWSRDDLEVNIDHTNQYWRELDWDIRPYLHRIEM